MKTKRNTKDSVFCCLFSDPEYQLQLYKELNPGSDIMIEDIQDVTIENIFTIQQFNDLGFTVKEEILFLVEAQSTWSENILLRVLFYYQETLKRRMEERKWNVYSSKKFPVVLPKFYVVYTGDKNVEDTISFKNSFCSNVDDSDLDIQVHVIHDTKEESKISSQYILFSKIFDEQRKLYGNTKKTIEETLRICKNKHILESFINSRESEVVDSMSNFMNQEKAIKLLLEEERGYAKAEGREEEKKNGIIRLAKISKKYKASLEECLVDVSEQYPEVDKNFINSLVSSVYQE